MWETSDKTICTVSNGKVTAKNAGTVTITCSLQSKGETLYTTSCEVRVIVPVKSIKLKEKAVYFKFNQPASYQLNYEIIPANATDKTLIFELITDDPKHVFRDTYTISETGLITAKKPTGSGFMIKVMSASNPKAEAYFSIGHTNFLPTEETIELTEPKLYKLRTNCDDSLLIKKEPQKIVAHVSKQEVLQIGYIFRYVSRDKLRKNTSVDVIPLQKGTGEFILEDNPERKIKISVTEAACVNTKNFPAIKIADAFSGKAEPGTKVNLSGTCYDFREDGGIVYMYVNVPKADDSILVTLTTAQKQELKVSPGDKVTVLGYYEEPLKTVTETGLTLIRPVIKPIKVNDYYYLDTV